MTIAYSMSEYSDGGSVTAVRIFREVLRLGSFGLDFGQMLGDGLVELR